MTWLGWALIQYDWCPYKDTDRYRGKTLWRHMEEMTFTSQRVGPQKRPILPTPWSQTPSFQNHEKKKFSCLTHLVCGYFVKAVIINWHTPPSDLGYITDAPIWSGNHAGQTYRKKAVSSPESWVSVLIHWFFLPSQSKRDGFASPDLK